MTRRAIGVALAVLIAAVVAGCQFLRVQPPPPAPGARECIGIPEPTCKDVLAGRINERAGVDLAGYRVTCKAATCTLASGEVEASLLWADGMSETFTYTWFGADQ